MSYRKLRPTELETDLLPRQIVVARQRRCLRCHGMFDSSWSGHRICDQCRSRIAALDPTEAHIAA